jgi:cell division protein FtsB
MNPASGDSRRKLLARGGVIVFLILAAVFAAFLIPQMFKVHDLQIRSQDLDRELKKLQYENQLLETELKLLRDDPVYLERVARQKLNKAKEGEIVYKVVREGEISSKSQASRNG